MTQPAPIALNYGRPPPISRTAFYFVNLMITSVPIGIWSLYLVFVVPKFSDIFKDFHTSLPLPTELVIFSSDGLRHGYLWPVAAAVAFLAPLFVRALRRRYRCEHGGVRTFVFILWEIASIIVLLVLSYVLAIFYLFLPMTKLIQSVSST